MMGGNTIGSNWIKNGKCLNIKLVADTGKIELANILKEYLEKLGIKIEILQTYYNKNNTSTGTIWIKNSAETVIPGNSQDTLLSKQLQQTEINNNMGLYYDTVILIHSKKLKGNFEGNWYNIFYNINNWYRE